MTDVTFEGLGLPTPLIRTLERAGFTTPTEIQAEAIPAQLQGRDILGIAQTGSGKTAAFGLPILAGLAAMESRPEPRTARALILAPTRELAVQIDEALRSYAGGARLTTALVLGGMSRFAQIQKLAKGVDILIATPGRLKDLLDDKKVRLDKTRWLVLDEADRMLDMGFSKSVYEIAAATPKDRQTALFSATMPDEIAKLAQGLLKEPVRVEASPQGTTVAEIDQQVILVSAKLKRDKLRFLLSDESLAKVIVFARTKHGADKVAKNLEIDGFSVAAIHGNKSQNARQAALKGFRTGKHRVLVATDIAARGIDVPEITHVINYELPDEAESYVHRIGRTGRNGATGIAITLCDGTERGKLRQVERLIRKTLPTSGELPKGEPTEAPAPRGRSFRPENAGRPASRPQAGKPGQGRGKVNTAPAPQGKTWWSQLEARDGAGRKPDTRRAVAKPAKGFGKPRAARNRVNNGAAA